MSQSSKGFVVPTAHLVAYCVLFAALVLFCIALYPMVPSLVPVHYGPSGIDRWKEKTTLIMMGPMGLYAFCASLFAFVQITFAAALTDHFRNIGLAPDDSVLRAHRSVQRGFFAGGCLFSVSVGYGMAALYATVLPAPVFFLMVVLSGVILVALATVTFGLNGKRFHFEETKRDRELSEGWRLGGIVYSNPNDPRMVVPNRVGFGLTGNMSHPRMKLMWRAALAFFAAFAVVFVLFL